eukprot:7394362-Heterocapsa_arctica.AAC.2
MTRGVQGSCDGPGIDICARGVDGEAMRRLHSAEGEGQKERVRERGRGKWSERERERRRDGERKRLGERGVAPSDLPVEGQRVVSARESLEGPRTMRRLLDRGRSSRRHKRGPSRSAGGP